MSGQLLLETDPVIPFADRFVERYAETSKRITKTEHGNYHTYWLRAGVRNQRLLGVTTAIGVLDKPALLRWAANQEKLAAQEAAFQTFVGLVADGRIHEFQSGADLDPEQLEEHVKRIRGLFDREYGRNEDAGAAFVETKRKAGDLGTQLHELIERDLLMRMGKEPPEQALDVSDKALQLFRGYSDWATEVSLMPLAIEFPIYAESILVGGTADCLARVNGRPVLIDWKTSKGIYPEAGYQNIAYIRMAEEMGLWWPGEVEGLIIQLPKFEDDDPVAKEYPFPAVGIEADERWEMFKHCVAAYRLNYKFNKARK